MRRTTRPLTVRFKRRRKHEIMDNNIPVTAGTCVINKHESVDTRIMDGYSDTSSDIRSTRQSYR